MLTPQEFASAQAIATWNAAHGQVLTDMTRACADLEEASATALTLPSEAAYAAVRSSGAALARTARIALQGPWAGVNAYDDPRRRGLKCYLEAGEYAARFDPGDSADPNGYRAGTLLNEGTQITAKATAFARDLLNRLP